MSEYVSKIAVLEWLNEQYKLHKPRGGHDEFSQGMQTMIDYVEKEIQSGRFDSDVQMTQSDVYRAANEILTLRAEIDRLRSALERIKEDEMRNYDYKTDVWYMAEEALSATTEPTGAERLRELWAMNAEEGNRADEEYLAGIVDTLNALGIKIPGINAPEKGDGFE